MSEFNSVSTSENKAIEKQMIMNHIHLPEDIIRNLHSFLFYDKEMYTKKKEFSQFITRQISQLMIGHGGHNGHNTLYPGHWSIYYENPDFLTIDDNIDSFQLQAINCIQCGNYILHNGLYEINRNNKYLYCQCLVEEEDEEDEEDDDDE